MQKLPGRQYLGVFAKQIDWEFEIMQTPEQYSQLTETVTSELDRLLGEIPESIELTVFSATWDAGDAPGDSTETVRRIDPFREHAGQLLYMALRAVIEPAYPDGTVADVGVAVKAVAAVYLAHSARHGFDPLELAESVDEVVGYVTAQIQHEHRPEATA